MRPIVFTQSGAVASRCKFMHRPIAINLREDEMLKQLLSILLILALMLPAAALGEEASAALPNIGDTVEGFIAIDVRDFPLVGGTAVLFEHDQTGAKLMYLANDDTNRTFDLTFRTQAIDNTGLPHVFEHSTLDGSEKYPSKALFFNLAAQTYNTFMNAMTYPHMTTYPIASLSEKQLLKYADYYTDSCLHPTIMQDESIYREEAWRYRLASMDDALTIEGTVYSEMLGALTLESMANANISRAAFPGSIAGNISGGDPAYIPDMTYEALCAYHNMYYHPSNCMAFLYGQFEDYTAFLKLLNDAFSGFEKREFSFEDPDYTPIEAPVEEVYDFPVEASSDPSNASVVYYAFVCPGLRENPEQELLLNTLTDLMTADASPMAQSIRRAIPTGSFASYIDTIGPEDAIIFEISNVEPEDAATFRDTVQEGLRQIAEDGFPQELVDGVMASLNLAVKLAREGNDVGVELICNIAYSALASGDPFDYMNYVDALNLLDDWNAQGLYAKAVSDWLLNSQTTALATTRPLPGLKEQNDAALAERLQSVKAEMDEETLQALIDQTNATAEEEDTSAYVSQLQAVSVDSLPEEIKLYPIVDEVGEDTVRRMSAEAAVEDVGRPVLWLDASGIAQEELHWFRLYLSMLGELDTRAHTREELATLMTRYLSGSETRVSITGKGDDYHPWLRAGWISMEDDLPQGYDLMYELLFDTDFTDASRLAEVLDQTQASLKSRIKQSPYSAGL